LNSFQLTKDKHFKNHLLEYFPKIMQEKFKDEIENHPLKQEIIRTVIANTMINKLGGSVISAIKRETGGHLSDIARAHEVVAGIFDLHDLWKEVGKLGNNIPTIIKVEMFSDLGKIMRRGISWFVRNIKPPIRITDSIEEYRQQTEELSSIISKLLVGGTKTRFFNKIEHYTNASVDKKLAKSIATLEVLVSAFDIIYIAKQTGSKNEDVANLYFECGDILNIDWLRDSCETQINGSYWNRLSVQSLKDDFYDKQRRLVTEIVANGQKSVSFKSWLKVNIAHANIFTNFIEEVKMQESININMIILANKKLEIFLRKLKASQ